jgi:hypothetical protein
VQATDACVCKPYRQPVLGGHQQPALAALALWALHDVESASVHNTNALACGRGKVLQQLEYRSLYTSRWQWKPVMLLTATNSSHR